MKKNCTWGGPGFMAYSLYDQISVPSIFKR